MPEVMACAALALFMGWVSRMTGGAPPRLPLGLDQWIYALPYAAVVLPAAGWWCLPAYAGAVIGKRTGHGQYLDMGTWRGKDKPEKLDFIVRLFLGPDNIPSYWRDAAGMAVTGLAVTIMPGITLAISDPLHGAILAVSGAFKAPAYMIGWAVYPQGQGKGIPELNQATQIGEFLTGVFAGLGVWLCI